MSLAINPDRPLLVGPEVPQHPFPHSVSGTVVKGYGRGSKELGIPTANLSDDAIEAMCTDFTSGIYYGWVQIGDKNSEVYPMVMSLGWNPYYQNEKRSAEVHIIHEFPDDFMALPSVSLFLVTFVLSKIIHHLMVLLEISEPMWKLRRNHFNALLMPNSSKMHCLYR